MKTHQLSKPVKPALLVALITLTLGCGYSKNSMAVQPGTMPAISQLNPASAAAGASLPFEVDGTNFAGNAVINFNGMAQPTTVVSSMKLEATVPATALMNAGTVPVTVTNPAVSGGMYGGGTMAATSSPMSFTIN
jgi:hypothetical protein